MNILIAPDKFKGSLEAREVCRAIEESLHESNAGLQLKSIPMADGGEGTSDMLTEFTQGKKINVVVRDPLFRNIESTYGISGDGKTAFVEMAAASGLQLLRQTERNVMLGTTFGTGQLIASALDQGVKNIVLGVGGSGTNDGGIGMGNALGAKFYDASGDQLEPIGKNLIEIDSIDIRGLHPRLRDVTFTAVCDVSNPLVGKNGAAYVFGPQKGATPDDIDFLDNGLRNFARVVHQKFGINIDFPGAGAGGGLGGGAKVFFDVKFQSGIEFVMNFIGLDKLVSKSDLVITGEGKMDEQTLSGKVVKGVADLCRRHQKRLIVVVGKNELADDKLSLMGVKKVVSLLDGKTSENEAFNHTYQLIKKRVREEVIPFFL